MRYLITGGSGYIGTRLVDRLSRREDTEQIVICDVAPPKTFSHSFNTPGTYLYFCSVHGSPTTGMRGTIVVQ